MFNKLDRFNTSYLGLISGFLIGTVVVAAYFIYIFNLGLILFLPPIVLVIIAAVLMFIHIFYKFSSTISNFISGIILVLAAFFIFIDFKDQIDSIAGIIYIIISAILTIISFFSIVFLMKAIEVKMLTEPQVEQPKREKVVIDMEKKKKEPPKPPMDRL